MSHDNSEAFRAFTEAADQILDPKTATVALDVGSRDAEIALQLKRHYSNAVIYAFECNPPAIELCQRNIAGRENVTLVQKAVSDRQGPVEFYSIDPEKTVTPHADGNIGASSLYEAMDDYPYEKYVQKKILVESVTLEKWARESAIETIDVIWMAG